VYLDEESFAAGGGQSGRFCLSCKQPIEDGQRGIRVVFNNDPQGQKGLTGEYHSACSRPYASMAHIINMGPWAR
jgi:hypothetical protein